MINLLVDEAYAFDYLSILYIKKNLNKETNEQYLRCFAYIEKQVGKQKMSKIISSKQYKNIIKANKITFEAVERARYYDPLSSPISAKEVDDANMLRYKRKLELQEKFFDNILTEKKT